VYVHYLRAEEGNHLELAAISGIPEKARQHLERLELGQAVCGTVALTHQAMVVEDVQKSTDPRTALIRSLGITVYACHPLIVQDRLVGTLSFGSRSRTNFDPPSLSLIRTVCDLVANAIDRKKSEQALQESEARFRSVIENSLDIAYRRNQKMDRYDYMSPVVMQVLGFSEDEMNAMGMDELLERIHPDDRQTITAQLAKANETGRSKLEYRFKNKDGQYRWLADYVTVTKDLDEQPLYRIGIVRDITHMKRVENELRSLNRGLEQRVAERTEELLEMQRRLMDGIEAERIQLAREIHDGPMQDIYALSYRIAGVDRTLPTENIENELASIQKGLLQINQTLRAISQDLLPPTLSQFGLEKSIREHIANIQQAHPELKINLDLLRDGKSLEERVRLALFRIYQTSITNVIRHAQARQVDIRFYSETEQYCLEIQDDGIGFGIPKSWIGFARKGHMGLVSAQERAQSVGGKMEVQSQPGKGTLLRVLVPRS
jgi:PAS domain S-box-containing protein